MNLIDNMDQHLTLISIIVTAVSVVCTIVSIVAARSTSKIKKEIVDKVNVLNYKEIVELYQSRMLEFRSRTRQQDWYKGKDVSYIIDPFETALSKLNSIYPFLENSENIQKNVNELLPLIRRFDTLSIKKVESAIQLMEEIDRELRTHLFKYMHKMAI